MKVTTTQRAKALGWFSLALGLTEVLAAPRLARALSLRPDKRTLATLRLYGLREIGAGVGILAQPSRAAWMWLRLAGDVLDLGAIAMVATRKGTSARRLGPAFVSVAGIGALDAATGYQLQH